MPLAHYGDPNQWWGFFCSVCDEHGYHRRFEKNDRKEDSKVYCDKHYKIEIRKRKLEKLNER